jgi:hypothetical protein
MDGTANKSPLKNLALRLLKHIDEIESAEDFRMKIHFTEHAYSIVDRLEEELQRAVVQTPVKDYSFSALSPIMLDFPTPTAAAYEEQAGSVDDAPSIEKETASACPTDARREPRPRPQRLPFKNLTLSQAVKALLQVHKRLHGKEIETLVKEGGYRTKARHFQQNLISASERDGGFINVGGNTWELKPEIVHLNGSQPEARQETAG